MSKEQSITAKKIIDILGSETHGPMEAMYLLSVIMMGITETDLKDDETEEMDS